MHRTSCQGQFNPMNHVSDESTQTETLLSIITVSRNDANRLLATIQSMQPFYGDSRFEHIVMDGGSTDHTSQMVAGLSHVANFRFHSGSDKGIYDAMNQGIKKSRGHFLLFLNCGDCMLAAPDDIAAWIKTINEGPAADIACFSFSQVEQGGKTRMVAARKARRHKMPTSHQAMLFSSAFIQSHSYNISYKIAADYDLYMRSRPHAVIIASVKVPLTAVEVDGVASSQPMISYREYMTIASNNLSSTERLVCMTKIGLRALLVIAAKSMLPHTLISKLRGIQ